MPIHFALMSKKKLNKIIRRKKLSLNLEKGIFNYTIQTARLRNV